MKTIPGPAEFGNIYNVAYLCQLLFETERVTFEARAVFVCALPARRSPSLSCSGFPPLLSYLLCSCLILSYRALISSSASLVDRYPVNFSK